RRSRRPAPQCVASPSPPFDTLSAPYYNAHNYPGVELLAERSRSRLTGRRGGPRRVGLLDDVADVLIREDELRARVADLGGAISTDYDGKTPLPVGILTGASIFPPDLLRPTTLPPL